VPELSAMFGRGLLFKHGAGWVEGDAFQLHGCAVLQNRAILSVRAARRMSESCSIAPMLGGAS
jgi:hypothetical protein